MSDLQKYVNAIQGDTPAIDYQHVDATTRLSELLPKGYLEQCMRIYRAVKKHDDDFKNGHGGKIASQLIRIEKTLEAFRKKGLLEQEQKRVLMHDVIMSMKLPPDLRVQCLVCVWGSRRIDRRRDIALEILIESIIEGLEAADQERCWTTIAGFLAEQGLWDTDNVEDAPRALRLRYEDIDERGQARTILDTIYHKETAEGLHSSTAI